MQHHVSLPWLIEQIRECLTLIEHEPERWLRVVAALAQLYAEWEETS